VRRGVLVVAAALLAGCGGDGSADAGAPTVRVKPGCERIAPPAGGRPATGLLLPRARVVPAPSRQRANDPEITIASGYIELEPAQLLAAFKRRPELKIVFDEDEGFDAEVMVTDGTWRNFWKVVKRCPGGSSFTTTIAPELAAPSG
jgi:hypothetical protein